MHFYKPDKTRVNLREIFTGQHIEEAIHQALALGWLPGVTTILGAIRHEHLEEWKIKQAIETFIRNGNKDAQAASHHVDTQAADFGTDAHQIIHQYLTSRQKGEKYTPTFQTNIATLQACHPLIRYLDQNLAEVIATEERFACPTLGFGGTIDLIYRDHDGKTIVGDMKFKKRHPKFPIRAEPEYAYQLAAYATAFERENQSVDRTHRRSFLLASPFGKDPRPHLEIKQWDRDFFPQFASLHQIWLDIHTGTHLT
jgi:hypothetical protein